MCGHVKISAEIGFRVLPLQSLSRISVMPYMILLALDSLVKKLFVGLGAVSHPPECSFQDIGGPDSVPEFSVKAVVVEAAKKILSHATHSPFFFNEPVGLPGLKTPEGLLTALCTEDELCLLKAVRPIDLSDLHGHIDTRATSFYICPNPKGVFHYQMDR